MEPDTWLKDCGDNYECIAVYVDYLLIASKDPKGLVDVLINKHKFKLKGTGPISYHLGYYFGRDDDGTLHFSPRKCTKKMIDFHFNMFRSKLKLNFMSPLEKGDHPELDTQEHLCQDGMQKHQYLAGDI